MSVYSAGQDPVQALQAVEIPPPLALLLALPAQYE